MKQVDLNWHDGQPYSEMFGDVYFSREDGLGESQYVFLHNNGLPEGWQGRETFVVAETGFGTGLNFMLTAEAWLKTTASPAHLYYYSIEKYPLSRGDLHRALSAFSQFSSLVPDLISVWPPAVDGFHCVHLFNRRITLVLMLGDVVDMLRQMSVKVDVWYLDGFAPACNPDMWRNEVFVQMAKLSQPNARFSTFTSAGDVRRGLQENGFEVEKIKGYGTKREMLRGSFTQSSEARDLHPWYALPENNFQSRRVAIIGAGIAGIASAWVLAKRGWKVDIYEQSPQPATGASGNLAGVLFPRIALDVSSESSFYASAFFLAQQYLQQLKSTQHDLQWHQSGVLQLLTTPRLLRQHEELDLAEDYVRCVEADEASEIAGIQLSCKALYFPSSGWLQPRQLCEILLRDVADHVTCHYGVNLVAMQYQNKHWELQFDTGNNPISTEVVILANGHHVNKFDCSRWLSVQPARGQITYVPSTQESQNLRCPVCYEGYVLPAMDGIHLTGATFVAGDDSKEMLAEEHEKNLYQLTHTFPKIFDVMPAHPQGRAAVRAVTPDRMPIVGPVADAAFYRKYYADLQRGRAATQYPQGASLPGLYVNSGHGARGLISAFLSAELLAAQIENTPLPVSLDVMHALHPARFIIRAFRKGRLVI